MERSGRSWRKSSVRSAHCLISRLGGLFFRFNACIRSIPISLTATVAAFPAMPLTPVAPFNDVTV